MFSCIMQCGVSILLINAIWVRDFFTDEPLNDFNSPSSGCNMKRIVILKLFGIVQDPQKDKIGSTRFTCIFKRHEFLTIICFKLNTTESLKVVFLNGVILGLVIVLLNFKNGFLRNDHPFKMILTQVRYLTEIRFVDVLVMSNV